MSYILRLGQIQTRIDNLQSELDTLDGGSGSGVNPEVQAELDNLQNQHDILQNQYNILEDELDTLQSGQTNLQTQYNTLNSEVDTLQSSYSVLEDDLGDLETQVNNLIASVNSAGINWSDITPNTIPSTFNPVTHASRHITGGSDVIPNATTTVSGLMSNTDKTKLDSVATQATQNSIDSYLLSRTNHTGSQTISTITNLQTNLNTLQTNIDTNTTAISTKEPTITNLPVTKGGTGNTSINIDNIFYASANNVLSSTPLTSYVRTLLDDTDANTFRTTLGLGSIATQNSNNVSITGGTISLTTINTNAIERATSGTLNLGVTANNSTVEMGLLATVINIGTGNVAKTINIGGHASDVLNIIGSVVSQNVTNTNITDKLITINKGGAVSSANGSGFEIEENNVITSYFNIGNTRNSFEFKTPNRSGILRITPSTSAFTHEIITANTANRTFTLPDADINLNSQAQNLVYASPSSGTGAMSIRSLVSNDIPALDTAKITTGTLDYNRLPLATNTLKGAISREASGTFTPVLEGGTTPGTNTYNSRIGTYILLGKFCIATIYIELATKDAAMSGNVTISGLPFTTSTGIQSATVSQYGGITLTAGYAQLTARIEASNTKILLFQGGSSGSLVIQASAISSSFYIAITAAYVTA